MQAVILAAGRDKEMEQLIGYYPKALLKIKGRPVLEYTLASLPREISQVILVVGFRGDLIKRYFGSSYNGREVRYAWQYMPHGTAAALWQIQRALKDRFLVINGDDLYHPDDLKNAASREWSILVRESFKPERFGVIELNDSGRLKAIHEKPASPPSNLVNIGVYSLNTEIFDYDPPGVADSFNLPEVLSSWAAKRRIKVEKAKFWHSFNCAADIEAAEKMFE